MNFLTGLYLEVLNFIRQHPEGCTADQIAEAFPDLPLNTRSGISHKLRWNGYIERRYVSSRVTVWVAVK